MNISELKSFIKEHVPNLTQVEIIGPGTAYHFTMHAESIEKHGGFLGRTVDKDIDRSADNLVSKKAEDENGVVYAYLDKARTVEEGCFGNCDLFKIEFSQALAAYNEQERLLDLEDGFEPAKIIFITAKNIASYKHLGKASDI